MKNIGETVFWVESYAHYGKSILCPMCFGKRFVTIILGNGTHTESECGSCGHGLDRATGQSKTWEPSAVIYSGQITGISTREGAKYEVGHKNVFQHECFDSEAEAIPTRDRKLKEEQDRAAQWFKDQFVNAKKSQIWSAGYHRECIKSAERTIEWHKGRLNMIKEKLTS